MKWSIHHNIASSIVAILCTTVHVAAGNNELVLEAEPVTLKVLERIPLAVKLTIRNTGEESVNIRFHQQDAGAIERYSALILSMEEHVYRLTYAGGPYAYMPALPADLPLAQGESIVVERVIPLITRASPKPHAREHDDWYRYKPIAPGVYTIRFEVSVAPGLKLVSNESELTILEAHGLDRSARDKIAFRHVDFFVGRDKAPDESYYHGGKWWKKVDVSRFGEIQKILDDFPDSTYAEWIRFWKVYHHGSDSEALDYVRAHGDFPLSDNLMFRVARRISNDDARHDRALELLSELQRIFPDGDTAPRAEALRQKLLNKRGR